MDEKEAVLQRANSSAAPEWVEERHPNIVVAIDFGMTCTGVAYSIGPDWSPPKTMQRWPGKLISELANKVPTCLEYSSDNTLKEWGFGCDPQERTSELKEYFKLHLTPQFTEGEGRGVGITRADAQTWFRDYIQCIYRHVVSHFESTLPGFKDMRVEFMFSVPTTWKDVRMIEETRGLLEKAIRGGPRHWAVIGLTEAEAAAVYACQGYYSVNDIILVCDSGGGTTDVNVLKLVSDRGSPIQLEQFGSVEGRPIGSVFVDRKIHRLISDRLAKVPEHLTESPNFVAWKMIAGRFQRLKCAYGTEAANTPYLNLDVPFLKDVTDLPDAEIKNGQMLISWDNVKSAFDAKIDEMCALLDSQIQNMQDKYPQNRISYLVLSGGFASSPYVRSKLHERYAIPGVARHPNVIGMQILMAEEPQLAVVHGMIIDRIQQLKRGVVTFASRCSPVSYGIICDHIYDPVQHFGQVVRHDPRDNRTYAVDQIDWLVIQGQAVPHTGICKEFQLKMKPGEEMDPWRVYVVMTTLPPGQLPQSAANPNIQRVCTLNIETGNVDLKLKNRHWYNIRPPFWKASFDVKVVVGPADLTFQLWSKDRRIRSTAHDPIQVQWMPATKVEENVAPRVEEVVVTGVGVQGGPVKGPGVNRMPRYA